MTVRKYRTGAEGRIQGREGSRVRYSAVPDSLLVAAWIQDAKAVPNIGSIQSRRRGRACKFNHQTRNPNKKHSTPTPPSIACVCASDPRADPRLRRPSRPCRSG